MTDHFTDGLSHLYKARKAIFFGVQRLEVLHITMLSLCIGVRNSLNNLKKTQGRF